MAAKFPARIVYRHQVANLGRELGVFLSDGGNDEAGAELFPDVIRTLDELAADFPSIPAYQYDLSRCRRNYGNVFGYLKKPEQATEQFREAVTRGEALVHDHPSVLPYQHELLIVAPHFPLASHVQAASSSSRSARAFDWAAWSGPHAAG